MAVIGTGATAIQVIGEIADKVGDLTVFQRRPNWARRCTTAAISAEEMAEIKARYDEIFAICPRTPGGFIHEPDRRPFFEVPREERLAMWEQLYGEPGFGIWLANFRDTFMDEAANAELSEFIADKIRARVHDPVVAEKLIPKDHGFGVQRVPMETRYYEAYNRPTSTWSTSRRRRSSGSPRAGIQTTDGELRVRHHRLRHRVRRDHRRLRPHRHPRRRRAVGSRTSGPTARRPYLGMQAPGFPNMLMPTGPQGGSASTNFPRGIEIGVDWVTDLLEYMWQARLRRGPSRPRRPSRSGATTSGRCTP